MTDAPALWFLVCGAAFREEGPQPDEVLAWVLGRDGDHRVIALPTDHLGDVADRHPSVGGRGVRCVRGHHSGRRDSSSS
jgi:hypothetical protein